jgi:hypothetical protein
VAVHPVGAGVEHDAKIAAVEDVPRLQQVLGDALLVVERPVGAAQVADAVLRPGEDDLAVATRHRVVVGADLALGRAPNLHRGVVGADRDALHAAFVGLVLEIRHLRLLLP